MNAPHQPLQNARILQIYTIYRLSLSLILLLSFFITPVNTRLGSFDPRLFLIVSVAYALYSLVMALLIRPDNREMLLERPLTTVFIADTIIIALLTFSSGGMVSGLGLLLIVTVAAGALLIPGRVAYLLPSIASLSLIYGEVFLTLRSNNPPQQYIQAGLLGALLFGTTYYLQRISARMRRSSMLAEQQATSIHDLEQLNYRIVQRMRTGMVLLDQNLEVISINATARELLGLPPDIGNDSSPALPPVLEELAASWQRSGPATSPPPIRLQPSGPQLQFRLDYLHGGENSPILIFIEDNSAFLQRVRQMKLASLGELTASIAHEIRNPLGAVTHANQLLAESPALQPEDHRLLRIMMDNSQRINLIIEDVLSLSRQQEQPAEDLRLLDWLTGYLEEYRESHCPDARVTLSIDPPDCIIRFIPSQLKQVLGNLLDNGLRYSRQATGINAIELQGGYRTGSSPGQVYLNIVDEGPGVPATEQERLFEPFHTTESSGTGLGLYISRQLCEANYARLIYRRTASGKSCFSLYFSTPEPDVARHMMGET